MKRSRDDFDNQDSISPATSRQDSQVSSPNDSSGPPAENFGSVKILHLTQEASSPAKVMRCSLPGHPELFFTTYDEYESHYSQSHLWKCTECRHNFPSEHYLGLHIEEHHDSMIQIRKERGEKVYSCFVEDCDKKCSAPHKRTMHLIHKHLFPKDYDFQIIRNGIDHRSSMLRSGRPQKQQTRKQKSSEKVAGTADEKDIGPKKLDDGEAPEGGKIVGAEPLEEIEKMDEDHEAHAAPIAPPTSSQLDTDMGNLAASMSSLKFVPPSIRFGRGGGRGKSRGGLSRT